MFKFLDAKTESKISYYEMDQEKSNLIEASIDNVKFLMKSR